MIATNAALLVIDVQESFRHRPYWIEDDVPAFVRNLQALVDGARTRRIPVIQVFHVEDDGAFSLASGHVRTMTPLMIDPAVMFHKRRHSALVGSGLDVWLVANRINRLIISGIRSEQCCETTTRHASDCGYEVDYVTDATLTFPMIDGQGRIWSSSEIKARSELVLAGRFARIASVREALGEASMHAA